MPSRDKAKHGIAEWRYNCAQHYHLLLLQLQLMRRQSQLDSLLGYHPAGFGQNQHAAIKACQGIFVLYDYFTGYANLRPSDLGVQQGDLVT